LKNWIKVSNVLKPRAHVAIKAEEVGFMGSSKGSNDWALYKYWKWNSDTKVLHKTYIT